MRKDIVRVVPFSPNVDKVIYSDGTIGLKGRGSNSASSPVADQPGTDMELARPDIMEDAPASSEELQDFEDALKELRKKHLPIED